MVRLAALTMVRDEAVMLPRWLAHYARECGGPEHCYVLDDNSTDGSTEGLDATVVPVADFGSAHFETSRLRLVNEQAARLLERYDAVVFADADELLVADPRRHEDLRALLDADDRPVIGAMNLNVVHDVAHEPPLDPARPVLTQRRLAKQVALMCKPAIKRVDAPWRAGSHGIAHPYAISTDLVQFHLKFADRDLLRAAAEHRQHLALTQGRAAETTWQFGGDDLVALLEEVVADADPDAVPTYRPRPRFLDRVVREGENGVFRAHGRRQHVAMRNADLVAVPPRYAGRA